MYTSKFRDFFRIIETKMSATTIRNYCHKKKVEFISNIISRDVIPINFKLLPNTRFSFDQIFYSMNILHSEKQGREWLYYSDNTFYCAYCLCFSHRENNRSVRGIKYVKGCRIVNTLNEHDHELNHISARNIFVQVLCPGFS